MNRADLERSVISFFNPLLKAVVSPFDVDCNQDGNLLINSLKAFLGAEINLCRRCRRRYRYLIHPAYRFFSRIMKLDYEFMRNNFLNPGYGLAWLKGYALMMKGIRKYGVRMPFTPAGPFEIVWNLTHVCNLRCAHCYEDAGAFKPELSTDEALQVLDVLSKVSGIGVPALSFSGGEPLMRKGFFEIASYAKKRIPYLSIATNGTLLTKDTVSRIKDVGIDYVEISLDGASPHVHDSFRGVPGAFKKTVSGIKNAKDAGLDVCIATTAHKMNLAEIPQVLDIVDQHGTRFMHFNYIPTGRAKDHVALDLTPDERRELLELLADRIIALYFKAKQEEEEKRDSQINVARFFSTSPQFAPVTRDVANAKGAEINVSAHYSVMAGVQAVANFLGGCGAGRLYAALEPNGDLKPCVFLPTNNDNVIGNILREDFEHLWDTSEKLWELRSRTNLKTHTVEGKQIGCGQCENRYICGGCRARSYAYFGSYVDPDVGCIKNTELWKRVTGAIPA